MWVGVPFGRYAHTKHLTLSLPPPHSLCAIILNPMLQEPTLNPRGTTWAHPFDFFPELCPLPEAPPGFSRGSRSAPLKPFSIGCLATSSGVWSEVVQVCVFK